MADFVRVSPDGFTLGGRPWYFCGTNCYYLATRAADPSLRHEVASVLDDCCAPGLTVLRTWAFADGDQRNALQRAPGQYDERVFRALDWVVAQSGRRRLRLVLCLTNSWKDYGGMAQYVRWSCEQRGVPSDAAAADQFYEDPCCQALFRRFITAVLTRRNTVTGIQYREDPTVLAWGLANEPQAHGSPDCRTVARWADATARFVKGLDANHLVTCDSEGFFGPSTPGACACNPYDCRFNGCDFWAESSSVALDFACCHMYPDLWLPDAAESARLEFALRWVDAHVEWARRLGKPLVLSEFGVKREALGRSFFLHKVYQRVLQHMAAGRPLAGTCFWMAAAPSYPDYDGFTIYLSSPAGAPVKGLESCGDAAAAVVLRHAAQVARLNAAPAPAAAELRAPAQPRPASRGRGRGASCTCC